MKIDITRFFERGERSGRLLFDFGGISRLVDNRGQETYDL